MESVKNIADVSRTFCASWQALDFHSVGRHRHIALRSASAWLRDSSPGFLSVLRQTSPHNPRRSAPWGDEAKIWTLCAELSASTRVPNVSPHPIKPHPIKHNADSVWQG